MITCFFSNKFSLLLVEHLLTCLILIAKQTLYLYWPDYLSVKLFLMRLPSTQPHSFFSVFNVLFMLSIYLLPNWSVSKINFYSSNELDNAKNKMFRALSFTCNILIKMRRLFMNAAGILNDRPPSLQTSDTTAIM